MLPISVSGRGFQARMVSDASMYVRCTPGYTYVGNKKRDERKGDHRGG